MIPDIPPNIDVSTQIKHEIEKVRFVSGTLVNNSFYSNTSPLFDFLPHLSYSNATKFILEKESTTNHSTWLELLDENLDIVSKITFLKSFKIKSKIKTISKYTPKIVID